MSRKIFHLKTHLLSLLEEIKKRPSLHNSLIKPTIIQARLSKLMNKSLKSSLVPKFQASDKVQILSQINSPQLTTVQRQFQINQERVCWMKGEWWNKILLLARLASRMKVLISQLSSSFQFFWHRHHNNNNLLLQNKRRVILLRSKISLLRGQLN